ncbi:ESPR-type extended signal peptide-containing protein, partial [Caviibacterium pharyngocola]
MNKIYRVIWNITTRSWVAVSKLLKSHTKAKSSVVSKIAQSTAIVTIGFTTSFQTQAASLVVSPNQTGVAYSFNDGTNAAQANSFYGIAIGAATADGEYAYALGSHTTAKTTGTDSAALALGKQASALANNSMAIGIVATASGNNSTSVGTQAESTAFGSTAIGYITSAKGNNSVAIGADGTVSNGLGSTALGYKTGATGQEATAIGGRAGADGDQATAIGAQSGASGNSALAIGSNAKSTANYATAIGVESKASAESAIAIGDRANASSANATALGVGANSSNTNSIALGYISKASGVGAVALGPGAHSANNYAVALGRNSVANLDNSVALGSEAAVRNASNATTATITANDNSTVIYTNFAGVLPTTSNTRVISVGDIGKERQIQNLAAGEISLTSTDAINGSQLYSVAQNIAPSYLHVNNGYNTTGNSTTNKGLYHEAGGAGNIGDIAIGMRAQTTKYTGNEYNFVHAIAIGDNAKTGASGIASVAIGDTATTNGLNAIALGSNTQASNNVSVAIGSYAKGSGSGAIAIGDTSNASGNISIALGGYSQATASRATAIGQDAYATASNATALGTYAKASLAGSVALGLRSETTAATQTNSATVNGITYTGFAGNNPGSGHVVSVGGGTNVPHRQIQNVSAGRISGTSTDAINGSQLYLTQEVIGNVANSLSTIIGGNAVVNPNGSVTTTNIGDTGKDTVHDAIKAAKTEVSAGTNVASVTSSTDATTGKTTYTVNANGTTASAGSSAVTVTAGTPDNNNVTDYVVDLSDDTKQTLNQVTTNTNNIANNTTNIQNNADNIAKGLNIGADEGSDDNVQLGETIKYVGDSNITTAVTDNQIQMKLNKDLNVNSVTANTFTAGDTVVNTNGLTINNGPSITNSGIDAGGLKITNVAEGTDPTDAVNVSQLESVVKAAATAVEAGTNVA